MTSRQGEKLEQIQGQLLPSEARSGGGGPASPPRGRAGPALCGRAAGAGASAPGIAAGLGRTGCGKGRGGSASSGARESRPIGGVREHGKAEPSLNARWGFVLRILKDERPLGRARRAGRALSREEEPRAPAARVAGLPVRPSPSPAPRDRSPRPVPGGRPGGGEAGVGGRGRAAEPTSAPSSIPPAGLGGRASRAAAVGSRARGPRSHWSAGQKRRARGQGWTLWEAWEAGAGPREADAEKPGRRARGGPGGGPWAGG